MPYQIVDIGSAPNAKDGDTARAAFKKINENFAVVFGSPSAIVVEQSADFEALSYTTYMVNTSGGPVKGTLPAAPNRGDVVKFIDAYGKFSESSFFIDYNGKKLEGVTKSSPVEHNTNYSVIRLVFTNNTTGWVREP